MRRLSSSAFVALLLAGSAGTVCAQDDARAVVAKAVEAQGGETKLAKVRAVRSKLKGTLYVGGQEVPFTGEMFLQLPSQIKIDLTLKTTPKNQRIIEVIDGEKGWTSTDGQTQDAETTALARMRQQLYLSRVLWLAPLLKENAFELTPLKGTTVNDRPALGVKVVAKGQKDVSLYFDKASGLLAKVEYLTTNNQGREVTQEEFFGDYADAGGIKRPRKGIAFQDGKKLMDVEITDTQFPESISATEFGKP
jgi:outer membrane lipoprotein-sorting protein